MQFKAMMSGGPTGGALKAAVAALALAVSMTAAPMAHASVVLISSTMDHGRSVTIGNLGTALAAPVNFTASINGGAPESFAAWCVDVYHSIQVNKTYASGGLQYTEANSLTHDFSAAKTPLDAGDTVKVGLLANYGYDLYDDVPEAPAAVGVKPKTNQYAGGANNPQYQAALAAYNARVAAKAAYDGAVADRYMRLSAIQGAIWQVVSNLDVKSVKADAAFDLLVDNLSGANLANYFVGDYGPQGDAFTLITPIQQFGGKNGKTPLALTQSFVFAEVPEPATWAMMILGFGAVGAVLRTRRRQGLAAA